MTNNIITPQSLYNDIRHDLDMSLIYAKDRIEQLNKILDIDKYVDLLSSEGFKSQQVKTSNDFLSDTNGTMTNHLDKLANYILFCKYDDEENKRELDELDEKIKEADRVNKQKSKELRYQKKQIKPHRRIETMKRGGYTEVAVTTPSETEWQYGSIEGEQPLVVYSRKDKELNQKGLFRNNEKYWKHYARKAKNFNSMFFKGEEQPYGEFCYETLKQLSKDIERTELLLETLEEGTEKYRVVRNNLSTVKTNYKTASEILRNPVVLNTTQVLQIKPLETMYDEIDYSDRKIARNLLTSYYRIKTESESKAGSMFWCIAQDMQKKIHKVRLYITPLQNKILDELIKEENISAENIVENIGKKYKLKISVRSVYRQINKISDRISDLEDDKLERLSMDWQ